MTCQWTQQPSLQYWQPGMQCLEPALVLKGRCGLPALWCSKVTADCQPAPLGSSFGAQRPLRAASPHRFQAALVLNSHCGLPARAAWKQLWCSKAAVGCQPALLCTAWKQLWCSNALAGCQPAPLRTVWKQLWCSKSAAGCQPAPLARSFGAQKLLRAGSPHRLQVTLVLKSRCGLPARTAWKQLWCSKAVRTASLHRLEAALVLKRRYGCAAWKQLWCSKHRCGLCRCRLLARTAAHCLEAALVLKRPCGLPARTAPHCLEAALVLKVRCGLPARTACKKLRCSKTAAGWQPAPLAGNSGAQKPLRAASPHSLEAALVLKSCADCQPAPLRSSFGAQTPLRLCGLEAALVLQTPLRALPLQVASPHRCALLGSSFGVQRQAGCEPAPL